MEIRLSSDDVGFERRVPSRAAGEILHDLVGTLSQVCDLLGKRASIKTSHRSIELRIALRKIRHDTNYLRGRLGAAVEL